jgi:nucleotide-binding universal stress UspA family protein
MYDRALVPLAGSKNDEATLGHLQAMLDHHEVAEVILVRVVEPPPVAVVDYALDPAVVAGLELDLRRQATSYLETVAKRVAWGSTAHNVTVAVGDPAEELAGLAESRAADLILLAPEPPRGVLRWVRGSLLDRLLRTVSVPITVLSGPVRDRRPLAPARRLAA